MAWSIADKTVLITGASAGIGLETARTLAKMGAKVIMLGRNRDKSEPLRAELSRESKQPVDLLIADLAIKAETQRVAGEVLASYPRLDVLINNAGAIYSERTITRDGLEQTFALNHLSYFLLTKLLLDRLKASAPARIINVASRAHRRAKIDHDDLQNEKSWSARNTYSRSKLLNVLFTYELARRLEGTSVTANCLHPGVIASDFGKSAKGPVRWFFSLARPFLLSSTEGAETSIYLATAPELEGVSGKYFANSREERSSDVSYDRVSALRLWEQSEALVAQV